MPPPEEDPLERAIAGALRDAIKTHGPITPAWIGSAVKRIVGNLKNAKLEAHARALGAKGGRSGTGDAKRRDVDYAALGRKGAAARAARAKAKAKLKEGS